MSRVLFEYSFSLFAPAAVAAGANQGTPARRGGAATDQLIDPVTLDYVRTANGEWAETADQRTKVLIALSVRLNRSPYDPADGTTIADTIERGDPITPEYLQAETLRAMQPLVDNAEIADLLIKVRDSGNRALRNANGAAVVKTQWRDLSSGSPVELTFTPR
jgi:hypothetical protein